MHCKSLAGVLMTLSITAIAGCGGSKAGRETTYEVSGKVTLAGAPLEGATVSFFPSEGQRSAMGLTDGEGQYVLTTYEYGDGAMPGKYKITIRKAIPKKPGTSNTHEAYASGQVDMSKMHKGEVEAEPSALPERYQNPDESGFQADVTAGGENHFDLPLEP
ncbi:hypothetical protein GC176_10680 [bacterium]|nr:hypothetical protein [bacterium]